MATVEMTKQPSKFKKFLFGRAEKPYVHPYLGGTLLGIVLIPGLFPDGQRTRRIRWLEQGRRFL